MNHQYLMPDGKWWAAVAWVPERDCYILAPIDTVVQELPGSKAYQLSQMGYSKWKTEPREGEIYTAGHLAHSQPRSR